MCLMQASVIINGLLEVITCCVQVVHSFYSKFTGLPIETVQEETDRDNFMSPNRAKEMGLIDGIV